MSSIQGWFRRSRVRRGLAVSLLVLSTGGLVLARAPSGSFAMSAPDARVMVAGGSNAAAFRGPAVSGRVALSHTLVLARGEQRVFAELDLKADPAEQRKERAPLAIAVALDTSGSMGGDKIEQAKRSAIQLVREMRDDDEIAFVRYASDAELVQPLSRVGSVRESLIQRIAALQAGGGTDIPPALNLAMSALQGASAGRVRRIVLASDGLDATRAQAELVAKSAASQGVTVSSMGIGLDFDEGYMGGVAVAGHGNFAFVKDASALAGFLHRELTETATTVAQNVSVRLRLPEGARLVQAVGADARDAGNGEIAVSVGAMFGGDERRVIIELSMNVPAGAARGIEGTAAWNAIGGDTVTARFSGITVRGSDDAIAVEQGRDGAVLANAVSVLASVRQIAAAEAYARGDAAGAQALVDQNMAELEAVKAAAPAAAPEIAAQQRAYDGAKREFARPRSAEGNAAAKSGAARDFNNLGRKAKF